MIIYFTCMTLCDLAIVSDFELTIKLTINTICLAVRFSKQATFSYRKTATFN